MRYVFVQAIILRLRLQCLVLKHCMVTYST